MVHDIYFSNAFFELSINIQDDIIKEYEENLSPEILEQIKKMILISRFEKYVGDSVEKYRIKKPVKKLVKKTVKKIVKKIAPIEDSE